MRASKQAISSHAAAQFVTLYSCAVSTDRSIIHFVYHFPSCSRSMSIIFPFFCSFQPSQGVGNNRDSDATLNLLRRRKVESRSSERASLLNTRPRQEPISAILYTHLHKLTRGRGSCMHVPLLCAYFNRLSLALPGEKNCPMSDCLDAASLS